MKKRIGLAVMSLCVLLALTACAPAVKDSQSAAPSEAAGGKISAEQLKEMLDAGDALTVLDVRSAEEYAQGHIPGAILLPNEQIGAEPPEALPQKDAKIIVYCRSGRRSAEAAKKLRAMGYTDVRDLGGLSAWPYETVSGAQSGAWKRTSQEGPSLVAGAVAESAPVQGPQPKGAPLFGAFATTDLAGNPVDQHLFEGHALTMVNVWATFCGPCLMEMPELGELAEQLAPEGVQIVGVVADVLDYDGSISASQVELAKEIVEKTKANYLHIVPSQDLYGVLSGVTAVPTTFFVNAAGEQVGREILGARNKANWEALIRENLERVAP